MHAVAPAARLVPVRSSFFDFFDIASGRIGAYRLASQDLSPTDVLAQKASEAEHLRKFIDRTTFAGDQREAAGELSAVDQHPADSADVTMQRQVDYTIKGVVEDEAHQVRQALRRQAEGRYGICEECNQPIDPERLAVRPQATLCVSCQRRLEAGPRAR
jgi:RNA polymerase-binding transcription factor DksA